MQACLPPKRSRSFAWSLVEHKLWRATKRIQGSGSCSSTCVPACVGEGR
uniref:Uncharacterized protein n=1 Tax=Arundo donax TaxID=35708 RepID=A0A0A9A3E6_ARUDO